MPWPTQPVSGARAASPRRRRSSIVTESCTTSTVLCVPSASSSFQRDSSMSLKEGSIVNMTSRCSSLLAATSVAMNNSWHPDCFCCNICQAVLADVGFVKNAGRHLCRPCHNREKARGLGKYICQKCHAIIEEQPLIFKNDPYHPDHFNCNNCGKELTAEARELKGELFCLPCHDKMGVPICGACRRPIEGRVVNAMGKQWHVEHFVCAKCEKPFLGHRHYERKGLAYCETHYNQLFGDVCYHCNRVIEGDVVSALNKAWCVSCFSCSTCNTKLTLKDKFVEIDLRPVCKHCYEHMPEELKRRLARRERDAKERKKKAAVCQ
ncbi:LIM and senescent cell antigen-like-containing domain protein 1 isoform X4 [Embiotoca jacksoni]|uniref:LIM and senescent cell antigen-like-containing domain protein 1 isoform X4 n=1 Tax=Embiotoca jacksoni TaxID=100190 RepID=UPI00370388BC